VSIIIILRCYQDYVVVKGVFTYIFLFMYNILQYMVLPYSNKNLNKLDIKQTQTCMLSMVLGILLYVNTLDYLQIIGFVLLAGVNILYMLNL
jgi:hypothetical protein